MILNQEGPIFVRRLHDGWELSDNWSNRSRLMTTDEIAQFFTWLAAVATPGNRFGQFQFPRRPDLWPVPIRLEDIPGDHITAGRATLARQKPSSTLLLEDLMKLLE